MARCNDCNRFVSMELGDSPDLTLDVDADGVVSGDVTITRNCAECGTELKEGKFDINVTISEAAAHMQEHTDAYLAHEKARAAAELATIEAGGDIDDEDDIEEFELSIENEEAEATEGGTSRKPTYGFRATFSIVCSCGKFEHDGEADDEMSGGEMDELG
jgi:hypothetical protein